MKTHITADGSFRCRQSPELQTQLRQLRESILARYEEELREAGVFKRLVLRWRIAREFRLERRKIEPSAGSLYSSQVMVR